MQAYALIAKGRGQISVFHERDAALKWLGLGSLPQKELPIADPQMGR
jgi:hypothetical protein